jgi:hypothetical protein
MPEMVTQRNSKSGNKESKEYEEYEEFKEATVVGPRLPVPEFWLLSLYSF